MGKRKTEVLTCGPVLGAEGRRRIHDWVRFRLADGGEFWAWGWMLLPWAIPDGCYVSLLDGREVQA